jgi:hypothetical protein
MKPDSMLVEPAHIVSARQVIAAQEGGDALAELSNAEPALASFIYETLAAVAGKLAVSGAPTELVQAVHGEALTIVLTCVQAQRQGHYELWKDTMTGTRLAQLDETFRAPPKRRRRKGRAADAGE